MKRWLAKGEIWVAPMVNPDGHEYCRTHNRLWRKNRRRNPDGSVGVDPNRNYGYMWGTVDNNTTSHVPSDDTYIGPSAFSEPETRAVRDLVAHEHFRGVITYQSYSQLILYPWGYTNRPIAVQADRDKITRLAKRMRTLIRGVHGVTYRPMQASRLYGVPVAGDTTDSTYGTYAIPSFTIELRPDSQASGGFILPARSSPHGKKTSLQCWNLSESCFRAGSTQPETVHLSTGVAAGPTEAEGVCESIFVSRA